MMAHLGSKNLRNLCQMKTNLIAKHEDRERRFHITSSLLIEKVRRSTFLNWSVSYVSPDRLAKAGFFYLRTADHVQCAFCKGIVGFWEEGDDPEQEHKKHFPHCALMNGTATGNVPLNVEDEELSEVYKLIQDRHDFIISSTKPRLSRSKYQFDWARRDEKNKTIAHPQFNTTSERKRTFKLWQQENGALLDKIAEAGFFWAGLSDMVLCFHCNGGLFNWKAGDNPWKDHARFYPTCLFVRTAKGDDFIRQCQNESPTPEVLQRNTKLTPDEIDLLMKHPMAKRLLLMGLQETSVREAFRVALERDGLVPRSVTDMLEMVFDVEEDMRRNSQGMNVEPEPLSGIRVTDTAAMEADNIEEEEKVDEAERLRVLKETLVVLKKEYEDEVNVLRCRTCQKEKVSVVFQPCGHFRLCTACAQPCSKCPSCDNVVRGTILPIFG
ncbi:putative inhibitor of apoptosis [Oratosquilla oratoria]|uniref:putative inhibitor of apoptosis n=1 Tax=Oratosquilla oratoria TaxID=337810 RepID=UPI003F758D11